MINIIGRKNIYLAISAVFVGAAIACMIVFGFHEGADFTGGTQWQFTIGQNQGAIQNLQSFFVNNLRIQDAEVSYDYTGGSYLVRFGALSEPNHQAFETKLKAQYPQFNELSFNSIGPSVGAGVRENAVVALILVIVGISLYISFAFRKASHPVASWRYGAITLVTLFHDVAIPAGMLAILGKYAHIEIDTNFIVALLVVMGFSVHDTIVVFDRIRENVLIDRARSAFADLVNRSVNQSLMRSLNTSLTLILVLLALYFRGPASLHYFILTLLVGVTTGIYSSIFVASPLLYMSRPKGTR